MKPLDISKQTSVNPKKLERTFHGKICEIFRLPGVKHEIVPGYPAFSHRENNLKNLVDVVVISELSSDPVFTFRLVCRRIKILESSCYAQTTRPFEIQK